jgi:hypothetical protein
MHTLKFITALHAMQHLDVHFQKSLVLLLSECPHADDEGIFRAFSPAGGGLGIRSLPNALTPLYRQQLFQQLVHAGKHGKWPANWAHRHACICSVGMSAAA